MPIFTRARSLASSGVGGEGGGQGGGGRREEDRERERRGREEGGCRKREGEGREGEGGGRRTGRGREEAGRREEGGGRRTGRGREEGGGRKGEEEGGGREREGKSGMSNSLYTYTIIIIMGRGRKVQDVYVGQKCIEMELTTHNTSYSSIKIGSRVNSQTTPHLQAAVEGVVCREPSLHSRCRCRGEL